MRIPLLSVRTRVALAVGVAAVVLVASVLPPSTGAGRSLGPLGLVGADKWAHAAGYAALATAVAYALPARSRRRLLGAVALAAAFGLAVEGVQHGLSWRSFDVADAAANAVGALVAAGAWLWLRIGRRLDGAAVPSDAR